MPRVQKCFTSREYELLFLQNEMVDLKEQLTDIEGELKKNIRTVQRYLKGIKVIVCSPKCSHRTGKTCGVFVLVGLVVHNR